MLVSAARSACLLMAAVLGAEDPATSPPLKSAPDPVPVVRKTRHYVVQVKLIEVDDQGRESVIGEPKLQTAGGNAGISVDHPDGRRFEFTIRLTDRLGPNAGNDDLIPAKSLAASQVDSITKKLEQKVDLTIQQQSRREVLREVSRKAGVSLAIDPDSIRAIATQMESPIDLKVTDESLSTVLDRVLEPLNLGYSIKHDVILIADQSKLVPTADEFVVKTYNVADLVKKGDQPDGELPNFVPLIDRIKSGVMTSSWERVESPATIRPFNSTLSIVVRQTPPGHVAIERLLEKIRAEKPMTILD